VIEGQVHPDLRRRGIGAYLLSWAHAFGGRAVVRTESLDPSAERLYERQGYRQVFAERVMRRYLSGTSRIPDQPSGIVLRKWSTSTQSAFFSAYSRAFKDRPGFPGWSEAEWVEWISGETGFRPDASFVAFAGEEPVGFIACAENWIEQVGVIPTRRGLGIGETLLRHSMSYLQDRGDTECWLNVNLDNPAYQLYRRLGFEVFGTRARYVRAEPGDSP
jgi:mycothiol synthase